MEISYEKSNPKTDIPMSILNLYKIYGYETVAYESYLESKKVFESKITNSLIKQENGNLLERIKNEILAQSEDKISFYIKKALESDNIEIQRVGASLIQKAPKDQIEKLGSIISEKIIEGLNNQDIQIQRIAINMIQFAPHNEVDKLREMVSHKIIEAFNSDDVDKWRIMAKKIKEAPEKIQYNLRKIVYDKIINALNSEDIRIQRFAATTVQYAPKDKQTELEDIINNKFKLAKQEGRFNKIIESQLYIKSDEKQSIFTHENFSKTGSRTTLLLGSQFKDNLIIRHIEEPCFSAWRKAYESYESWTAAGFDYIPIEPIHSFKYNSKSKLVDVASGVLDINLEEWYAFSGNIFKEELDKEKNKIIDILSNLLYINHGHTNDSNFCLRFYRDENGSIDINQIPKIYLIDFDKAIKY